MDEATEKSIRTQINLLMREYRQGKIDIHQLIRLIDMVYRDYMEFFPEELNVDEFDQYNTK